MCIKARDTSAEMKDLIKAEEGVKENGELTYSRLQEREGFVLKVKKRGGLVFRPASNQELMV